MQNKMLIKRKISRHISLVWLPKAEIIINYSYWSSVNKATLIFKLIVALLLQPPRKYYIFNYRMKEFKVLKNRTGKEIVPCTPISIRNFLNQTTLMRNNFKIHVPSCFVASFYWSVWYNFFSCLLVVIQVRICMYLLASFLRLHEH